jgi:hypothetical protein
MTEHQHSSFDRDPLGTIYTDPADNSKWAKLLSPDNPQQYQIRNLNSDEILADWEAEEMRLTVYLVPGKRIK